MSEDNKNSVDKPKVKKPAKKKASKLLSFIAWSVIATPFAAILGVGTLAVVGIEDQEGATQTLEAAGFDDIKAGGQGSMSCRGLYKTHFEAVNGKGKKIEGSVCKEIFSNPVIKFNPSK